MARYDEDDDVEIIIRLAGTLSAGAAGTGMGDADQARLRLGYEPVKNLLAEVGGAGCRSGHRGRVPRDADRVHVSPFVPTYP